MSEKDKRNQSGAEGGAQAQDQTLAQAARKAVKALGTAKPSGKCVRPAGVARHLRADLETLRACYKKLVYSKESFPHAYEWLFDNYYILEREGRILVKALSRQEKLPAGSDGLPGVHTLARAFCEAAAGKIDAVSIENFLASVQEAHELLSAELGAFGLMLRAALIEGAAHACSAKMPDPDRERLFSDAVKTLNFLTTFDFSEIIERQSRMEQILAEDPAGFYGRMDERSRAVYRRRLAAIARRRGIGESEAAARAVALAKKGKTPRERHVGFYILEQALERPLPHTRGRVYLVLLAVIPAVLAAAAGLALRRWWLPPLLYLPLWVAARPVLEHFIMKGVPATFLPRLDLDGTIPDEAPTLVIISTLLSSTQKAGSFMKKLERCYHANGRGNIRFGILADLKESNLPERPEDKSVRAAAVKALTELNRRCGGQFYLFIRDRRRNGTQGNFSGWERKRGAIVELMRCIKGRETSITTVAGDAQALRQIRYIVTLDADTDLLMDTAAEMVSVAMHPLNTPVVDEERRIVTKGYGILSPRMGVDIKAAGRTPFSRIMAGCGGVTAYDNASGNTYQDLFGEGIFAGKGLIDVDAFSLVLDHTFPENRILSHDILEGCFMRAAFLSDVELTDGFPARPGPWYDRLHRWIRGDWQNVAYIGRRIPGPGGKIPTPFSALSRFKLFDNLRRSATPAAAFLCVAASAFAPLPVSLMLLAAALLALAGAGLWGALLAVIQGGPSMLSRKYHCRVLPQAVNSLAQAALAYLFLPYETLVALDGIARALWRLHTGRKLLEWTTAAETESRPNAFSDALRRFWPVLTAGLVFVLLAPSPAAKIAGAFWLVTPFLAWLAGRESQPRGDTLGEEDRDRIRSWTAAMWRYYEDYAGPSDHFLPPDNVQEAPVHAVAHRTSPTNIGLLLLSTLAARDFGLIDSDALFDRVSATLSTVENLEKWNGHLLNWYDTRTLEPLRPRYVSTVDSGNFLCSLIALREGCRDYRADAADTHDVFARIRRLLDAADITLLYNKRRKLFHIGFDVEKNELGNSYYDLLMSEARMTSYYAVARRAAPKRHWGALGRTLARENGYTGPISWTGTMFEYLMPHLLLPVYEDSMAAEALRFALYCQKQRVQGKDIPWGVSESGFYAFDAALNYQYKAHGVQKIALKRGMNEELVISPYSTFLALPFDPRAAMINLTRLEELGLSGRCGFFEAIDFTFRRTEGAPAPIKSYMAHHVGMSIVAAANAMFDGVMQERFMRDNEMRAAQELLQEKIPSDAVVFRDVLRREVPDKPGRIPLVREEFDDPSPVSPRVQLVSNGEYTLVLTDTGASLSLFRGIDLTRRSSDLLRDPPGLFAVASFGSTVLPLTRAPVYPTERLIRHRAEFNSHGAVFRAKLGNFEATMHAALHGQMPVEARFTELANYTSHRCRTELLFYFEPTLSKTADEAAHPAFSRLFLSSSYSAADRALLFSRRPHGGELPAYLAAGLAEFDTDFEYETSRAALLERPEGIGSLADALRKPFSGRTGAAPDAAAAFRITADLPAHSKRSVTLLLAAANTPDEALRRLAEARREGFHEILRGAAGKDANNMESRLSALILPQVLFPVRDGRDADALAAANTLGQQGLWSLGISGDFPLVLLEYDGANAEKLEPYLRTLKSLRLRGILIDLAITYREGGDYARAQYTRILETVRLLGCEYLLGARGGVHPVNLAQHPPEIRALLSAAARHCAGAAFERKPQAQSFLRVPFLPAPPPKALEEPAAPAEAACPDDAVLPEAGGEFRGGAFVITANGDCAPPAPWCQVLANPAFGTIVSDRALGCTWAVNARENKLTPWKNDPVADNRGEMLALKAGTRYYDLLAGARVAYRPGCAVYESAPEGLSCRTEVFVPAKGTAKLVRLTLHNDGTHMAEIDTCYYAELVLGVGPLTARLIAFEKKENLTLWRNPWAPVRGFAFLDVLDGPCTLLKNRAAFFAGRWGNGSASAPASPDPCATAVARRKIAPGETATVTFALGWAASADSALRLRRLLAARSAAGRLMPETPLSDDSITIRTPDRRLDALMNGWLRWQFMASRIMGRTGFYQCGGAWGFRDQLQDVCGALLLDPSVAKSHIFRAAAHQFEEGDVMHWWHQLPPRDGGARGVRTRCSDDMLWLPYAVCEYLEKTGDHSVLTREIHYLTAPELEQTESDRYFAPQRSECRESVYRHCLRAVERAGRLGPHGLPLFGSGDWNDGMNLVGTGGRGESVWLAIFLILVLERFAPVCEASEDPETAARFREQAAALRKTVEDTCWDGTWYLRGFYDDGAPLGSKECDECRIDLLPQSFAAIARIGTPERRRQALDSALSILCDRRLGIVRLFDPPFDHGGHNPGYIRAYPPGIRENGGQYTHGAVWLALALCCEGRGSEAAQVLSMLSPAEKAATREGELAYRLEPYVLAGDVSANAACEGRGGWSFYTGAAAWYYRTVLEGLLGIRLRADGIRLSPVLPDAWPGFSAALRLRGCEIEVEVRRGGGGLTVDGRKADEIPLDGRPHRAVLEI